MTPDEVAARLVAALDESEAVASVSDGGSFARATVDVPPGRWTDAVRTARDDAELACDYFDWLSAVDEMPDGFAIVTHLWSTTRRHGILLRTRLTRDNPRVASIVDVFPGASWHERETAEMFGIDFADHPNLIPLLLSTQFEGHPLRKDFVLASRVVKDWPGAREPGESHDPNAPKRGKMRPPGVPDPNDWGPLAGTLGAAEEDKPARGARGRDGAAAAARARTAREPGAARPAREPGAARPVREPGAERPARPARTQAGGDVDGEGGPAGAGRPARESGGEGGQADPGGSAGGGPRAAGGAGAADSGPKEE